MMTIYNKISPYLGRVLAQCPGIAKPLPLTGVNLTHMEVTSPPSVKLPFLIKREAHPKLILRPLSELNEVIEHKGKRFKPLEVLNSLFGFRDVFLIETLNSGLGWEITPCYASTFLGMNRNSLILEKLLEWNFDIYNLIPEGYAVSYRELDGFKFETMAIE